MKRMREEAVRVAVSESLTRDGFSLRHEFPLLGRVADVYGIHETSGTTLAVECKEKDWSRAIRQARVYQGAAELVYVALPASRASENARQAMAVYGLGLLAVDADGSAHEVLSAKPAEHLVPLLLDSAKRRFVGPRPAAVGADATLSLVLTDA